MSKDAFIKALRDYGATDAEVDNLTETTVLGDVIDEVALAHQRLSSLRGEDVPASSVSDSDMEIYRWSKRPGNAAGNPPLRNYVQEERTVSDRPGTFRYVVRAYSILTTDTVMFDVYEPIIGPRWLQHGTSTMSDTYGPLGAVRTRHPEATTLEFPYGEERTARVLVHYRGAEAECEAAIHRAFPELAAVAEFQHGHATVTITEFWEAQAEQRRTSGGRV